MPKFETKNALFGHFWTSILKNLFIFEISTLKFVYLQNFARKTKMPKFGTKIYALFIKMPYLMFGYFSARILKNYSYI